MDIIMPDMSGIEVTKRIRKFSFFGKVKIIALSASKLEEPAVDMLKAEFDDFFPKPILLKELFDMLEKHLALEWTYIDKAKDDKENDVSPLSIPSEEIIKSIYYFAEEGDLKSVKEEIDKILQSCSEYSDFCNHVNLFVEAFEIDKLIRLLRKYMEKK